MSVADEIRFEELLSRHLDAKLGQLGEQELLKYLSRQDCAARFLEMTKLNAEIKGLSSAPVPDAVMAELILGDLKQEGGPKISPRAKSNNYSRGLLALAAAIVGLLAFFSIYHLGTSSAAGETQGASATGDVYFVGQLGRMNITVKQTLPGDGKLVTMGPASRAILKLADGTRVEVYGNTSLVTDLNAGKHRILLEQGTLRARVAKQRIDQPLIFCSENAIATVRGTELKFVGSRNHSSVLIVIEGAVLLKRSTGGPEILVTAGFHAGVEENRPLKAAPNHLLPKALQADLAPSRE